MWWIFLGGGGGVGSFFLICFALRGVEGGFCVIFSLYVEGVSWRFSELFFFGKGTEEGFYERFCD